MQMDEEDLNDDILTDGDLGLDEQTRESFRKALADLKEPKQEETKSEFDPDRMIAAAKVVRTTVAVIVAGAVVVSAIAAVTVAATMIILLLVTGLLKVKLTMKARMYILDLAAPIAVPIAVPIA